MNKIIILFFFVILFSVMDAIKLNAQTSVLVQAVVTIVSQDAIKLNYINGLSQNVPNSIIVLEKSFIIPYGNGELKTSTIQNLASFSITGENKNSFSVSLPSQAVILKNSKNTNTLQMVDWQSSVQPAKGEFEKNIWIVNFGAFFKMGSVNNNPAGVYSGTYPITFVYN